MIFDNLDVISKEIMKPNNEFKVKHTINLSNKNEKNDKKYNFYYDFNVADKNYVNFKTYDNIIIESTRDEYIVNTMMNGGKYVIPPRIYISYMEAPLFIIALDKAMSWLTIDNKNIFESDKYGSPIKIKQKISEIIPIGMTQRAILEPIIVYDDQNFAYQGISISNESKLIGKMTAQEFLEFSLSMKYILMNLYMNSNILTLIGMIYYMNKEK